MDDTKNDREPLRVALPKGRMQAAVERLLSDAGIEIRGTARAYRPAISLPDCEAKLLKPQNVIGMLDAGSRDVGFAGADWVAELGLEVVELLDTELDPVRLVAAAPSELLVDGALPNKPLILASEYQQIATTWVREQGIDATVVRSGSMRCRWYPCRTPFFFSVRQQ